MEKSYRKLNITYVKLKSCAGEFEEASNGWF